MTKKKNPLTPAWLRPAIIAAAACILPHGLVTAQDFEAVERRLGAGVEDGELTLDQAKLMLDALKRSSSSVAFEIEAKTRKYREMAREIEAAVEARKLSKEEAERKFIQLRKEMTGGRESEVHGDREMEAKKAKFMAVAREIEAAVEAGKLSKEDAQRKLTGLREEMFGGGESRDSGDREIEAKKRKYMEVERDIKAAVENGRLSKEDAMKKLNGLREEMFGGGGSEERGDREMEAKKARFMAATREIKAAVEAGRISEEDARKRLIEMRKSMGE